MDMDTRDLKLDESLGLNCAWYADILMTLTADGELGGEDTGPAGTKVAPAGATLQKT